MKFKKVGTVFLLMSLMLGFSFPFSTHAFAYDLSSTPPASTESVTTPTLDGGNYTTVTNTYSDGTDYTSSTYNTATTYPSDQVTLATSPISQDNIQFNENKNLTYEQVTQRFEEINSNYEIGEQFSPEDAEFVRAYGSETTNLNSDVINTDPTIQPPLQGEPISPLTITTTEGFSKTKSEYGVSVHFHGRLYSNVGIINNSYRGNMGADITSGSSKVTSIRDVVTNWAYGYVGTSGTYIGLVYNGSSGYTSSSHTKCYMDRTVGYTAVLVAYTYTNAYTRVNTSTGSFDLYAF